MIRAEPDWILDSKRPVWTGYSRAWLLPKWVLGEWYCLDRDSGNQIWTSHFYRPNSIVGVAGKVIVASEIRSDSPWTLSFGCYGISLESGRLLWNSHADGKRGRLLRLLDFVPAFTNEFRDDPEFLLDTEVFCRSGRILDVNTGRAIRRIAKSDVESARPAPTAAWQLYESRPNPIRVRYLDGTSPPEYAGCQLSGGSFLSHKPLREAEATDGWHLYRTMDGREAWHFDLTTTGYHIDGNYRSYRLAEPYVYLVVSEEPQTSHLAARPTRYQLLSLELCSGRIVQDVPISSDQLAGCRIEDIDDLGMLVSCASIGSKYGTWRQLRYYPREHSAADG